MYYVCRAVSFGCLLDYEGYKHDLGDIVLHPGQWYLCSEDFEEIHRIAGWIRTGWVQKSNETEGVLLDTLNKSIPYHITLVHTGPFDWCDQFRAPMLAVPGGDITVCALLPGNINLCNSNPITEDDFISKDSLPVWKRHAVNLEIDESINEMWVIGISPCDGWLCYYSAKGLLFVDYMWCKKGRMYICKVNREGQIVDTPIRTKGKFVELYSYVWQFVDKPHNCDIVSVPEEIYDCDSLPLLMRMPDGGLLPYKVETTKATTFKEDLSADALRCEGWVEGLYARLEKELPIEMVTGNMVDTIANAAQLYLNNR